MNELISVIIPVFNIENYIAKCIESVMDQSYSNLEIIIIDDGSTDGSSKICDEYSKKDGRIQVIHQKNVGLSGARNNGIKLSKGDYIAFLDGDDYIEKDMYELLYKNIKSNNADISICEYVFNDDNTKFKGKKHEINIFNNQEAIRRLLYDEEINSYAWNKLYSRKLFENIKYPLGKKFEDIGTTYLLIDKAKKIIYDNSTKYHYIVRTNSITKTYSSSNLNDYMEMVNNMLNYIAVKYPELKEVVDTTLVKYCINFHTQCVKGRLIENYNSNDMKEIYKEYKRICKEMGLSKAMQKLDKEHKFFAILLYYNRKIAYLIGRIIAIIKK